MVLNVLLSVFRYMFVCVCYMVFLVLLSVFIYVHVCVCYMVCFECFVVCV